MDQAFDQMYKFFDSKFEQLFKMLETSSIIVDCKSRESGLPSSAPIAQPPPHRPPGDSEADHGTPCPSPTLGTHAAQDREPPCLDDSASPVTSVSTTPEDLLMSQKSIYSPPQRRHFGPIHSYPQSDHPRRIHRLSTEMNNVCPRQFGGRFGSFETWLHKFNVIARDCNWSCAEKLRLLTASLAGRGINTSQLFPEEVRNNFPSLCRALRRKYGTPLQDRRLKISSPYSCHGCGGKGHYVRDCSTRKNLSTSSVRCYECGGYGHISIYCGNNIHHQVNGPPWNSRSNSPDWRATMGPLNLWTETTRDR